MKAAIKKNETKFKPIDVVITIQNREDLAHFLILWNMSETQYKNLFTEMVKLWGADVPKIDEENIEPPISHDLWKELNKIYETTE